MQISDAFLKEHPLTAPSPSPLAVLEAADIPPEQDPAAPVPAIGRMPGAAMPIGRKVAFAFGLTALAIALFIFLAIDRQIATVEQAALLEARHVGYGIATTAQEIGLDNPERLQQFVALLNQSGKRDVVIVDSRKIGIADANPEERGLAFDGDSNGEVAHTLADGRPRTFVELNKLHPEGIRQVVVPIHQTRGSRDAVAGRFAMN
jgi:hypothetical protein